VVRRQKNALSVGGSFYEYIRCHAYSGDGDEKIAELKLLLNRKIDTRPIPFHWPNGGLFKSENDQIVDNEDAENGADDDEAAVDDDLICTVQHGMS
jgi:hypothetical protein